MKKNHEAGFSLIEILTVIAILSILAVIALRIYSNYLVKAEAIAGVVMSSNARVADTTWYTIKGTFTGATNASLGLPPAASINDKYISSVSVNNGIITVTYSNNTHKDLAGKTLVESPYISGDAIYWSCQGSTVDVKKYLKSFCG